MYCKTWKNYLLIAAEEELFPADAQTVSAHLPAAAADDEAAVTDLLLREQWEDTAILYLVKRDPMTSRGVYAVEDPREIEEETTVSCLQEQPGTTGEKAKTLYRVVNMAFPKALEYVCYYDSMRGKKRPLTATLVGLGDVGGTVLMGLKLLGTEFGEIRIFDPNEAACRRYETELNQVLPITEGQRLPKVTICSDAQLFDCDVFLFTASRGVPGLDSGVKDVRMAQFEANRKMLDFYAKMARDREYTGLFCQISDPVDHLAREVFLASNRSEDGDYDFHGLLPEQVQGFGLGVMAARAAYYAAKGESPIVYGPHGNGLIVANAVGAGYDENRSQELTRLTREANLRVRDLGYKPYIAPGLSSAAVSILRMLRGIEHHGTVPLDGAYFGCRSMYTPCGILYKKEQIGERLLERLQETHTALKEFHYGD